MLISLFVSLDYFYFYYENFVITIRQPTLMRAYSNAQDEAERRDMKLSTSRPVYAMHTKSTVAFLIFVF